MDTKHTKTALLIVVGVALLACIIVIWFSTLNDKPFDYSLMKATEIQQRIEAHEIEIQELGDMAIALDADRYWPYDRDQTVLGMFLFRENHRRWPADLSELKNSGYVRNPSHIHNNWRLVVNNDSWVLNVIEFGPIARYDP